jgi:hypothetical protein
MSSPKCRGSSSATPRSLRVAASTFLNSSRRSFPGRGAALCCSSWCWRSAARAASWSAWPRARASASVASASSAARRSRSARSASARSGCAVVVGGARLIWLVGVCSRNAVVNAELGSRTWPSHSVHCRALRACSRGDTPATRASAAGTTRGLGMAASTPWATSSANNFGPESVTSGRPSRHAPGSAPRNSIAVATPSTPRGNSVTACLQWPASSASRSTRPLLPRELDARTPRRRPAASGISRIFDLFHHHLPAREPTHHPLPAPSAQAQGARHAPRIRSEGATAGDHTRAGSGTHPPARSSWARLLTYDCWSAPAHDGAEEARGCWPPRGGVGRRQALGPLRTTAPRRRRVLAVARSC